MRLNNALCHVLNQLSIQSIFVLYFIIILLLLFNQNLPVNGYTEDTNNNPKIQKFNFVAAGDFGCGDETNRTVDGMRQKNATFVLALGDLSYKKSVNCWLSTILPLESNGKIKISFGDHDLHNNLTKYKDYLKHFNMSKPYYSFDYQNVHFLALATGRNSIVPYQIGSEQYNFVKEDLRSARNNKSIDWIIVYSFRPFYSSLTTHNGEDILSKTYHPIFDKYGVDIVLQAHNHNYQRTFPLRYNEGSFSPQYHPIIADKKTTEYKNANGTIFLTVGTGGAELHNFSGIAPFIAKQFESHGFLNVDINSSSKELKLLGMFYENTDMNKKDHFSIIKKKFPVN